MRIRTIILAILVIALAACSRPPETPLTPGDNHQTSSQTLPIVLAQYNVTITPAGISPAVLHVTDGALLSIRSTITTQLVTNLHFTKNITANRVVPLRIAPVGGGSVVLTCTGCPAGNNTLRIGITNSSHTPSPAHDSYY